VGTPQVPEVADDSRICLQKMIRERQDALERQRHLAEEQITACRRDPDMTRLTETREELAHFDRDAYRKALDCLANQEWLSDNVAELSEAQQRAAKGRPKLPPPPRRCASASLTPLGHSRKLSQPASTSARPMS
jgi:hypothetical protein